MCLRNLVGIFFCAFAVAARAAAGPSADLSLPIAREAVFEITWPSARADGAALTLAMIEKGVVECTQGQQRPFVVVPSPATARSEARLALGAGDWHCVVYVFSEDQQRSEAPWLDRRPRSAELKAR